MLGLSDIVNGCAKGIGGFSIRRTVINALVLFFMATLTVGCAGDTARILCVVPMSPENDASYAVKYSREAALTGALLIRDEGYAAIAPGSVDRPAACVLLAVNEDTSKEDVFEQARLVGADLVAFLWIQRIETAAIENSDEHAEWGGFVLCNIEGQELAGSRNSVDESGGVNPSVSYLKILEDGDPQGLPAVRRFSRWLIGSPAEFGRKLDQTLGSL